MALNLHFLRIFLAVAEHGSFSRAAETLHISQPALSKAVQELERQVHVPLFDRTARGVARTDAGGVLLPFAQQLFAVERAAEDALAELHGLARGHLSIGASTTIGMYVLPALMGIFHQRYPQVELFLDIGNTQQIIERLRNKPLDIAFVEGPVIGPDLEIKPWRDDSLVVIAAPHHPLVAQQPIPIDHLCAQPHLVREPGSGTREVVEAALRERGIQWPIAMELGSTEAIKHAVVAGLGLAIVSSATIEQEQALGRLVILDVRSLHVRRTLLQVYSRGRPASRACAAFEALLQA